MLYIGFYKCLSIYSCYVCRLVDNQEVTEEANGVRWKVEVYEKVKNV